jgi:hypothetical protein
MPRGGVDTRAGAKRNKEEDEPAVSKGARKAKPTEEKTAPVDGEGDELEGGDVRQDDASESSGMSEDEAESKGDVVPKPKAHEAKSKDNVVPKRKKARTEGDDDEPRVEPMGSVKRVDGATRASRPPSAFVLAKYRVPARDELKLGPASTSTLLSEFKYVDVSTLPPGDDIDDHTGALDGVWFHGIHKCGPISDALFAQCKVVEDTYGFSFGVNLKTGGAYETGYTITPPTGVVPGMSDFVNSVANERRATSTACTTRAPSWAPRGRRSAVTCWRRTAS